LRSLKQATYTPDPVGHYALASDNYCHFTSPIRRYPDLQVHRQLALLLEGKKPRGHHDELTVLAEHCTRTERRAEAAEREIIKIKLLTHLETRIGETFHAVIIGVEDFGFFCRLQELPAEGLVHVTSLADDFYYLEPETHTLIGRRSGSRRRLGDQVEVKVAHVDVDRRQLDLVVHVPGQESDTEDPELHLPRSTTRPRTTPPKENVPPHLARPVRHATPDRKTPVRGKTTKKGKAGKTKKGRRGRRA
jgi:ribonuclease R